LGHDVLTTQESDKANQAIADDQVLAYASAQGRAILTLNRKDFIRLHSHSSEHQGIVVCTSDLDFDGQASRIDAAIRERPSLAGQLIRVQRPAKNA
jgi:hypothetical protein